MLTLKRIVVIMLTFLLGMPLVLSARNPREIRGLLVTSACDTLEGFVRKVPDRKSYSSIEFRTTFENEYTTYLPLHVEAFISEELVLISHKVNLNNVDRYIFIRRIFAGELDLYHARIEQNSDILNDSPDLYFAGLRDGKLILMHKRYLIQTLIALFSDCDCAMAEIDMDKFDYHFYNNRKLLHLFETYTQCRDTDLVLKTNQEQFRILPP